MSESITRRELLTGTLAACGAGAFGALAQAAAAKPGDEVAAPPVPAFRIAHLTDIHIQPERRGAEGLAACLEHVRGLSPRPDLVITGGDLIMDGFAATERRTKLQWDLWRGAWRDGWSGELMHCLGNHDIWGWDRKSSETTGDEPLWGKKWACDLLELPSRFYSFDRGGWHFVVLDSTHPHGEKGYTARLDEEQWEWLCGDLKQTPAATPVVLVSHIPILDGGTLMYRDTEKSGNWVVPHSWMHIDARRIKDLFAQHPNVRLCLSGHIHLYARTVYNGVTYVGDGAVSGAWWKGMNEQTPEGYGLVDLARDGTFTDRYVTYGWKAEG